MRAVVRVQIAAPLSSATGRKRSGSGWTTDETERGELMSRTKGALAAKLLGQHRAGRLE